MKKTLLALTALLGFAGSAMATEVVFDLPDLWKYTTDVTEQQIKDLPAKAEGAVKNSIDFKTNGITLTSTDNIVTMEWKKGANNSNGPIYYNTNGTRTLREYKQNTITITSTEDINKIEVYTNTPIITTGNNAKDLTPTVSSGELAVTGKNIVWTPKATDEATKTVTFTMTGTIQFLSFTFNPEVKETEKVADIAAFVAKKDTKNPVIIEGDVTVYYVNGQNMYIQDNSGRLCVYGQKWAYAAGDVIPGGFEGVFELRNGLPQMTSPANFAASTSKVTAPAPEVVAIDALTMDDYYKYVTIEGVSVTQNNRNFTFTSDSKTLAGYNQFYITVPTELEGATFDVTGIVGAYSNNPQILVTEFVKKESSAIDSIGVDANNAPVEYFNLQGQRVANPENGLFIRRQGNTVTKVIIR